MFRRVLLEYPTLPLQLQLTHPRWEVALSWVAFALAWVALALCGHWQGWPIWAFALGAALSGLARHSALRRKQARLQDLFLCVKGLSGSFATAPNIFLGTFSKNTGQIALTPVTLQQHWTHIFGLTLRLNLQKHPHNKAEVVTVTLWRSQLPAQTYRRLKIWAVWQKARCTPLFKGETA